MGKKNIFLTKTALFIALLVLLLSVAAVLIYLQIRTDAVNSEIQEEKTLNFLIMVGEDNRLEYSEVLMFQSGTGKSALLDIPNNLGTLITSKDRIAPIDSVFDPKEPQGYIDHVEKLIGVEIPYYLYISTEDLIKLVDLLEGVEVFIANPVENHDEERVLIPSGSVTLDGAKAVTYSLYSEPGNRESDRVSRRQKLLQGIINKMGDMQSYLLSPEVRERAYSLFSTNLSSRAFSSFISGFSVLDSDQFIFQRVLGKEQFVEGTALLFPHYDGNLLEETVEQTRKSLENAEVVSSDLLNLTLEILNGTGTSGLAGRTSRVFDSFGYDVGKVGNASEQDLEKTTVIARNNNLSAAQRVANIIRCKNVITDMENLDEEIVEAIGTDPVDVTILLGKDFDGRYCKE
ncbi:MAG: LCP family protein [Spirochaetaceae bacterium]